MDDIRYLMRLLKAVYGLLDLLLVHHDIGQFLIVLQHNDIISVAALYLAKIICFLADVKCLLQIGHRQSLVLGGFSILSG